MDRDGLNKHEFDYRDRRGNKAAVNLIYWHGQKIEGMEWGRWNRIYSGSWLSQEVKL
jgi:hypothetical protein